MSTWAGRGGNSGDAGAERGHRHITPEPERKHPVEHWFGWFRTSARKEREGGRKKGRRVEGEGVEMMKKVKRGSLTCRRERFRGRLTREMGE